MDAQLSFNTGTTRPAVLETYARASIAKERQEKQQQQEQAKSIPATIRIEETQSAPRIRYHLPWPTQWAPAQINNSANDNAAGLRSAHEQSQLLIQQMMQHILKHETNGSNDDRWTHLGWVSSESGTLVLTDSSTLSSSPQRDHFVDLVDDRPRSITFPNGSSCLIPVPNATEHKLDFETTTLVPVFGRMDANGNVKELRMCFDRLL